MKCKAPKAMCDALYMAVAVAVCHAATCTDEELRRDVLEFLTTRCCGRVEARRVLTKEIRFDGDTNRLACILAEFAQTNDARIAELAMWQLGKYATPAQLPFLYSCATNPVLGRTAVESVLRVEGVTSNSLAVVADYLTATNLFTRQQAYDRAICCAEFIREATAPSVPAEQKERALLIARNFAANVNTSNSVVDKALLDADSTYRYSVRRLSVMRAAYPRCFNEYQTNYVANAISELVDYPESELPD